MDLDQGVVGPKHDLFMSGCDKLIIVKMHKFSWKYSKALNYLVILYSKIIQQYGQFETIGFANLFWLFSTNDKQNISTKYFHFSYFVENFIIVKLLWYKYSITRNALKYSIPLHLVILSALVPFGKLSGTTVSSEKWFNLVLSGKNYQILFRKVVNNNDLLSLCLVK